MLRIKDDGRAADFSVLARAKYVHAHVRVQSCICRGQKPRLLLTPHYGQCNGQRSGQSKMELRGAHMEAKGTDDFTFTARAWGID